MQIIEVSSFGVRSAAIRLRHRQTPLQFVIYPMIHMAEDDFYRGVGRRLKDADVIVAEGVRKGRSRRSNWMLNAVTLSYRVMRFNRRAKRVVEQDIDYSRYKVPVINPDITADEFRASWRTLGPFYRLLMSGALVLVILVRLFGGTETLWTKATEVYDLPMVEEEDDEVPEGMPDLDEVLDSGRDRKLLDALSRLVEERGGEKIEVAIVYGAGHVATMVAGLMDRHGYRPRSADWLTVVRF